MAYKETKLESGNVLQVDSIHRRARALDPRTGNTGPWHQIPPQEGNFNFTLQIDEDLNVTIVKSIIDAAEEAK